MDRTSTTPQITKVTRYSFDSQGGKYNRSYRVEDWTGNKSTGRTLEIYMEIGLEYLSSNAISNTAWRLLGKIKKGVKVGFDKNTLADLLNSQLPEEIKKTIKAAKSERK